MKTWGNQFEKPGGDEIADPLRQLIRNDFPGHCIYFNFSVIKFIWAIQPDGPSGRGVTIIETHKEV